MSNEERKANLPAIIKTAETTFTELARRHGVPDFTFAREAAFAIQILKDNDYLAQVAVGNPDSLKEAIINVAAIGLSLSPINKQAYLVPRLIRKIAKVCLDISFQGLIDLYTSRGAILWAKPVLVYDADTFEFLGPNKEPVHKCRPLDPPDKRGKCVGGYILTKLPSGDFMVDFMAIHQIIEIRDRTEAYKAFLDKKIRSTPWVSDFEEMCKKTLVRRGSKTWPKVASPIVRSVLEKAIDVTNDTDGIDFNAEQIEAPPQEQSAARVQGLEIIHELLDALDRTEPAFVEHATRMFNRKIENLEDLIDAEIHTCVTYLESVLEKTQAKLKAALEKQMEKKNENAS